MRTQPVRRSTADGMLTDAGDGKALDFRFSQALANPPSQKGAIHSFIFRDLSPPVSPDRSLVQGYTF